MLYVASALAALALPYTNYHFNEYKKQFGKVYESAEAEGKALKAWEENDMIIKMTNAKNLSYSLGHNEFSDLTWDEFRVKHMSEIFTNRNPKNANSLFISGTEHGLEIADSVDWVAKGAVTPVKNQAQCGSCWAFSTTGSVEGAYQIASGKLASLSEEDLVQCAKNGNMGCNGGLMDNAFEWIEKNGIASEEAYPYTSGTGTTGTCDSAKKAKPVVTITGFKDVPKQDEDALKDAVSKGPVSIAIEADKSAFQLYKKGILDNPACGTQLDHGVLIAGYGTDGGKDYWKVKNSWGATWGESGYIRMVRGKNQCGIAMSASRPTGAKAAGPSPPSPSPPSPTPPSPTPPAPSTHYGDPKDGCMTDETAIQIQGVAGDFCSPKCGWIKKCATDVPAGVTAEPTCALSSSAGGQKYCALICSASLPITDQKVADAQCGKNASCKAIQGTGICTYDD